MYFCLQKCLFKLIYHNTPSPGPKEHYDNFFFFILHHFTHFLKDNKVNFYFTAYSTMLLYYCGMVHIFGISTSSSWLTGTTKWGLVKLPLTSSHCTRHPAHCTMHAARDTLQTAHCTLQAEYFTMHNVH